MYNLVEVQNKQISHIIPLLTVTNWSAFTNQPDGDSVDVISDSASDVGFVTIWGTDKTTGLIKKETVNANGTSAVTTSETNWGNIYSVWMGDENGKNNTAAVGTVTIRESSADQTITTITAGNYHSGMILFQRNGSDFELETYYGNLYLSTTNKIATATTGQLNQGHCVVDLRLKTNPVSIISDDTGAYFQLTFFANS